MAKPKPPEVQLATARQLNRDLKRRLKELEASSPASDDVFDDALEEWVEADGEGADLLQYGASLMGGAAHGLVRKMHGGDRAAAARTSLIAGFSAAALDAVQPGALGPLRHVAQGLLAAAAADYAETYLWEGASEQAGAQKS